MGGVVDMGKSLLGMETSAMRAARKGGQAQAAGQQRGLDYLMEADVLPQEIRQGALGDLGALFGLTGTAEDQAGAIEALRGTPIYQATMGAREGGEEAILRQAAATGGLRSGNVQHNLYDYNVQLENQAMMQGLQGLTGLAGMQTGETNIANLMAGIGQTKGQAIVGAGQAQQAGQQQLINTAMSAASMFSDRRLKKAIRFIGKMGPHNIYEWVWNETAEALGLYGPGLGVMAEEAAKVTPEAIGEMAGYQTVNYSLIGA
jgi:hypothetical protein